MYDDSKSEAHDEIEAKLDGLPVKLPSECSSLNAIRCYLEMLALGRQRILYSLNVDGQVINPMLPLVHPGGFFCVEAETIDLKSKSVLTLETASQQINSLREQVETTVTLVLINDFHVAREIWWNLAKQLKEPVLMLSLLPDNICGPANGRASFTQLRKWQLEQVAAIIGGVDEVCHSLDVILLSDALETRVLPWLQKLGELVHLWSEALKAGLRLGIKYDSF
jgi:hypothetical protein